tara:strand:+ start:519 stop:881 length:363 start_codon:yes stop_codon:yes gene_type:complete
MNNKLIIIVIYLFIIKKEELNLYSLSRISHDYFDIEINDPGDKEIVFKKIKSNVKIKALDFDGNLLKNLKIINIVDFNEFIFVQIDKNHELDKYHDYQIDLNNLTIKPTSKEPNIKIVNF